MRVIVAGSRWPDPLTVENALSALLKDHGPLTLVHGACSTGADAQAHHWWLSVGRQFGCGELQYRAEWARLGKRAGPIRNRKMIAAGGDLLLAFPVPGDTETQGTVDLARVAGIEVREWRWKTHD